MINITGTVMGAMNALNAHYNKKQLAATTGLATQQKEDNAKNIKLIKRALYDEDKDISLYEQMDLMNERLMPGGGVVGEGLGKEISDIKEMLQGGMNSQKAMMAMQNADQQAQARQQSLEIRKMVRNQAKGGKR